MGLAQPALDRKYQLHVSKVRLEQMLENSALTEVELAISGTQCRYSTTRPRHHGGTL